MCEVQMGAQPHCRVQCIASQPGSSDSLFKRVHYPPDLYHFYSFHKYLFVPGIVLSTGDVLMNFKSTASLSSTLLKWLGEEKKIMEAGKGVPKAGTLQVSVAVLDTRC